MFYIIVSALAIVYVAAYIVAPMRLKPRWEKKQAEFIEKKMSKGEK